MLDGILLVLAVVPALVLGHAITPRSRGDLVTLYQPGDLVRLRGARCR
jgi:hypothetical protein